MWIFIYFNIMLEPSLYYLMVIGASFSIMYTYANNLFLL